MGKKKHVSLRNSTPETRKPLKRDPGVPGRDLKVVAAKMVRSASRGEDNNPKRRRPMEMMPDAPPEQIRIGGANMHRIGSAKVALDAQQRRQEYDARLAIAAASSTTDDGSMGNLCLRRFYQDFQHVVEVSDVLLEVLDARDPLACRLRLAEDTIRSQYNNSKKIVLMLNKMDLVPVDVALSWLTYLRSNGDTVIAFSTMQGRGGSCETSDLTRRCIDNVFKVLRDHSRMTGGDGKHKSITVGVIGYPNVGKSSIINALKRKDVVGVANMPGSTKGPAEIDLRHGVKIVDCPGVVFDSAQTRADLVLINAIRVADVSDPVAVVARIVDKVGLQRMTDHYRVAACSGVMQLLTAVAIRKGRLQAGGTADEEGTARCILKDWNDGLIAFYTVPPQIAKGYSNTSVMHLLDGQDGTDETVLKTTLSVGMGQSEVVAPASYALSDTVASSRLKVMKRLRQLNS